MIDLDTLPGWAKPWACMREIVMQVPGEEQRRTHTMVDLDTLPGWLFSIDSRNRLRACEDAGIEPRFVAFEGTADEAASRVESLNLHRRHLTAEFRRQRVGELRAEGMSTREIAAELKVGKGTVYRDLRAGAPCGAPDPAPSDFAVGVRRWGARPVGGHRSCILLPEPASSASRRRSGTLGLPNHLFQPFGRTLRPRGSRSEGREVATRC